MKNGKMYKGQETTAGYFYFEDGKRLISILEFKKLEKIALIVAFGIYTGLRIGDILTLKWNDILKVDVLLLKETKTKKFREITLNDKLKTVIKRIHNNLKIVDVERHVFSNKYNSRVITIQYINRVLKRICTNSNIVIAGNISTHSFRKTFGRRVYELNGKSDEALLLLSIVFNHSNTKVTRRYLGIKREEIANVYTNL